MASRVRPPVSPNNGWCLMGISDEQWRDVSSGFGCKKSSSDWDNCSALHSVVWTRIAISSSSSTFPSCLPTLSDVLFTCFCFGTKLVLNTVYYTHIHRSNIDFLDSAAWLLSLFLLGTTLFRFQICDSCVPQASGEQRLRLETNMVLTQSPQLTSTFVA